MYKTCLKKDCRSNKDASHAEAEQICHVQTEAKFVSMARLSVYENSVLSVRVRTFAAKYKMYLRKVLLFLYC
jgi:hypothetical protein